MFYATVAYFILAVWNIHDQVELFFKTMETAWTLNTENDQEKLTNYLNSFPPIMGTLFAVSMRIGSWCVKCLAF